MKRRNPEMMSERVEEQVGVVFAFGIVGGPDVERMCPQLRFMQMASSRALRFCKKRYSPVIDQFQIFDRIDGKIWSWEKDGIEGLRVSPKHRWVRGCIYISKQTWSSASPQELAELIIDLPVQLIEMQMEHLRKRRVPFDEELLRGDLDAYRHDYWKQLQRLLPNAPLIARA